MTTLEPGERYAPPSYLHSGVPPGTGIPVGGGAVLAPVGALDGEVALPFQRRTYGVVGVPGSHVGEDGISALGAWGHGAHLGGDRDSRLLSSREADDVTAGGEEG